LVKTQRIHFFSDIHFDEKQTASDVDRFHTKFIRAMILKVFTSMFDYIRIVGSGLSAVILIIVYGFSYLIIFVFDINSESDLALLAIVSQDAELCLKGLGYRSLTLSGESSVV
jgi:hypothetical protein